MATSKTCAVEQDLHNQIKSFENEFSKFASDVSKLAKALKDAKSSKSTWPMRSLSLLDRAVKNYIQHGYLPNASGFAESLRSIENSYKTLFHTEFGKELCEQAGIANRLGWPS
jgi:hypothetical protein